MVKRTRSIGEKTYALLLPTPRDGMLLSLRTATIVGPGLTKLFAGLKISGLAAVSPEERIERIKDVAFKQFGEVLLGINPEVLDALLMDAAEKSKLSCDGKPICDAISFQQHFDENRADVFNVLFWALWECVHDFFPIPQEAIRVGLDAAKQALQSQQSGN